MTEQKAYIIYALADPRSNKVHYVGMTDDVYQRFLAHIQCSGNNFEKNTWVMSLREANVIVQMLELERVERVTRKRARTYALTREAYWIRHYNLLGHPLTNVTHARQRSHSRLAMPIDPLNREPDTTSVPEKAREAIRQARSKTPPMSHRKIAALVGLTGRKYPIYQQVCREMGLMSAAEAAE
jgi:predicted GIY-YIG superfamily endonuclease